MSYALLIVYCDVDLLFSLFFVFFFKQKTAYEMRISDWSSDVCSSDLPHGAAISQMNAPNDLRPSANEYPVTQNGRARPFAAIDLSQHGERRSEEHTSELQSLMRISYDVFCLKQTNDPQQKHKHYQPQCLLNEKKQTLQNDSYSDHTTYRSN